MDEVVTDDQRAVLEQTAKFAAKECPIARLRDGIHREPDFRTRYWRQAPNSAGFFPCWSQNRSVGEAHRTTAWSMPR